MCVIKNGIFIAIDAANFLTEWFFNNDFTTYPQPDLAKHFSTWKPSINGAPLAL